VKAISLWQPWATLMASGAKAIETRGFPTKHRGPLAIHAAARFNRAERELCGTEPFRSALAAAGISVAAIAWLPLGAIVAVIDLYDVVFIGDESQRPPMPELAFGNYELGRCAWMTRNARCLEHPVPWKGKQGFFTVPDEVLHA
jgi:hypothetical protein